MMTAPSLRVGRLGGRATVRQEIALPNTLDDRTWTTLVQRIQSQRCLPFLGAGASYPALPLGSQIATDWAREYGYPLADSENLTEVAQFLAVQFDPLFPKIKVLELIARGALPDATDADEPHACLASLPLPIYLTTNYDGFLTHALKSPPRFKDAKRELCRWNEALASEPSIFDAGFEPSVANPVVYHLHGHTIPESLVLTEDDYLNFLASIARNQQLLPTPVQTALDRSTCLFIGYRLKDWNFRVLFQALRPRLRYTNVAVLKPSGDSERARHEQEYLERYYANLDLQVYWGTAREFCADLRARMR
jgi:hypothetical protein